MNRTTFACLITTILSGVVGCQHAHPARSGSELVRSGDEIMVCGKLFHTGAPVVLWVDPGGYDAYRTEKRFGPATRASAGRTYGIRMGPLTDAEVPRRK